MYTQPLLICFILPANGKNIPSFTIKFNRISQIELFCFVIVVLYRCWGESFQNGVKNKHNDKLIINIIQTGETSFDNESFRNVNCPPFVNNLFFCVFAVK